MKKLVLVVLFFSLSSALYVNAQEKQTQKAIFEANYQNLKSTIKSQQYQYVGHVVYNSEKRQILDKGTSQLTIDKNKATGTLQSIASYAYTIDASNSKVSNYNVVFNDDKQIVTIAFNLGEDELHIEVKPNGNAFINIKSGVNKISQTGVIERI